MTDTLTIALLNRLHEIERYSLANYLRHASPWTPRHAEPLRETLLQIADDQQVCADRVASMILERDGRVEKGSFPFRFTAYNDLSLEFLAPRVLDELRQTVRHVGVIVDELAGDPEARALAREIEGMEKGHVDQLRELLAEPARDTQSAATLRSPRRVEREQALDSTAV